MTKRSDYPCHEALNDLQTFFNAHITDQLELRKFSDLLKNCKSSNRVAFRHIHQELMNYRKEKSDYFPFSEQEKEMIEDLLYFWG